MSKFKVGDRVTCGNWCNAGGNGYLIKEVHSTYYKVASSEDDNFIAPVNYYFDDWDERFELVTPKPKSPVVEKKVKSIEPGVYGRIRVEYSNGRMSVGIDRSHLDTEYVKHGTVMYEFTASELESAAKTFMELVAYLREKE